MLVKVYFSNSYNISGQLYFKRYLLPIFSHLRIVICTYLNVDRVGWLVVLGFYATLTAKVISWRSVTHMCFLAFSQVFAQLFFPKPLTTFLIFAELRGENTPESKFFSTGDQTHSHQVISPTRSPLSHPGWTDNVGKSFNPLQDYRILAVSKFKAFEHTNISVWLKSCNFSLLE